MQPVKQTTAEVILVFFVAISIQEYIETYKRFYQQINWRCGLFAGTLASIHSEAENWFIWETLAAYDPDVSGRNFWLGMRKDDAPVDPEESNKHYHLSPFWVP